MVPYPTCIPRFACIRNLTFILSLTNRNLFPVTKYHTIAYNIQNLRPYVLFLNVIILSVMKSLPDACLWLRKNMSLREMKWH